MKHCYQFITVLYLIPLVYHAQQPLIKKAYTTNQASLKSNFLLATADNAVLDMGTMGLLSAISKFDYTGNWLWTKSYQFQQGNFNSVITQAETCSDSSFVITGFVKDAYNNSNCKAFCARLKPNGDVLWCQSFTNTNAVNMIPYGLCATSDSGLVVCGQALTSATVSGPNAHAFAARFSKNGSLSWLKTFNTSFYGSSAYSIKQTVDSGFVISGWQQNGATVDICASIIKLDKTGSISWHKKYCDPNNGDNSSVALDISEEKSGYLCAIQSNSDLILLKTNFTGNPVMSVRYAGIQTDITSYDRPMNLRKLSSHRRLLSFGTTSPYYWASPSSWVVMLDTLGGIQWKAWANLQHIDAVRLKNKSQVIIGNRAVMLESFPVGPGNIGIVVTDSAGSVSKDCYVKDSFAPAISTLNLSTLSSTFITGGSASPLTVVVNTVSVTVEIGCMLSIVGLEENRIVPAKLYPNPSRGKITIQSESLADTPMTFNLIDVTGRCLMVKELAVGKSTQDIDLGKLQASVYFYSITQQGQLATSGKLVILE